MTWSFAAVCRALADLLGPLPAAVALGLVAAALIDEFMAPPFSAMIARRTKSFSRGVARRAGLLVGGAALGWLALAIAALVGRGRNPVLAIAALHLWALGALHAASALALARRSDSAAPLVRATRLAGAWLGALALVAAALYAAGPLAAAPLTVHGFKGAVERRTLLEFLERGGLFERAGGASAVVWRARLACALAFGAACALSTALLTWAAAETPSSKNRSAARRRSLRRAAA